MFVVLKGSLWSCGVKELLEILAAIKDKLALTCIFRFKKESSYAAIPLINAQVDDWAWYFYTISKDDVANIIMAYKYKLIIFEVISCPQCPMNVGVGVNIEH